MAQVREKRIPESQGGRSRETQGARLHFPRNEGLSLASELIMGMMHDEHGPCAPGDDEPPNLAIVPPMPEVERVLPDKEFAEDIMRRVRIAMDEHVFPIFEEASKRGFSIGWTGLVRGQPLLRWQITGLSMTKTYEPRL